MSRPRLAVVAAVLLAFVAVGAYLIFTNRSPGPQNVTFDVTVTAGASMKPNELKVRQNDTVTINITSDKDGEGHLHGYDCKAGQVVSHTFKAVKSGGPFDLEWESTATRLGDLIVNP